LKNVEDSKNHKNLIGTHLKVSKFIEIQNIFKSCIILNISLIDAISVSTGD